MSADCIFCKIVAGELPSEQVGPSDDADFLAFRDVSPKAPTHVLIIPREHHQHLDAWVASDGASRCW